MIEIHYYCAMLSHIDVSIIANVTSSEVNEFLRKQLCLNDERLLELCEIGIYLQESYGSPRDIEWAIHKVFFQPYDSGVIQ